MVSCILQRMLDALVKNTMHDEDRAQHARLPARHECSWPCWSHTDRATHVFCCQPVADRDATGLRRTYCPQHALLALSPVLRPPGVVVPVAHTKPETAANKPQGTKPKAKGTKPVSVSAQPKRVRTPGAVPGKRSSIDEGRLRMLHAQGLDQAAMAADMGVSRSAVCRKMKRLGLEPASRPGLSGPARARLAEAMKARWERDREGVVARAAAGRRAAEAQRREQAATVP